jgi:hypothetical protein
LRTFFLIVANFYPQYFNKDDLYRFAFPFLQI